MRLSYTIGPLLILTLLSSFGPLPGQTLQAVKPGIVLQTGAQQYVTLLPKVPSGSPSPWLIYPTSSTVWVAGIGTNPVSSQIREFFVNETSKVLLSLPNVIVSSILADPVKPSTKVWFTENSTLAFYDTSNSTQTSATRAITFQDQSIQYLANDTHGRIWMSMVASSGASTIGMYDPSTHLNQTYAVPTNGTIVQGITVNALGDTIWFAEAGSRKIGRLVPGASQPFSEYSPPSSVSLSAPIQVAVDASGGVWFTDHGSNQFRRAYGRCFQLVIARTIARFTDFRTQSSWTPRAMSGSRNILLDVLRVMIRRGRSLPNTLCQEVQRRKRGGRCLVQITLFGSSLGGLEK